MPKAVVLEGIIGAYRNILESRYQYQNLTKKYTLPASITEAQIDEVRNYFLCYIYPDLQKREALNDAFESLDNYIKSPNKLLRILVDSTSLILRYGRHLPKILNSGIKALRSFRDADAFEKQIVEQALKEKKMPPYTKETIYSFIGQIPRNEVDQFIEGTRSLFNILHDKTQVQKIIKIIAFLISKMKKHPRIYSKEEINGLEIGHELIKKGNALFESLGKENQEQLIDFIVHVENSTLDEIYPKK